MNLFELLEEPELQVANGVRPTLLPIQEKLLERGRAAYRGGVRRVIWQAPCGSGKTVVAAEQTRRALELGKRVLHVVHRRRLVDQMMWTLEKFGISAAPIMDGRQTWTSRVYCASRDTLLAIIKAGRRLPETDLLVIDECHVAAQEVQDWYLQNLPLAYWCGYTASPVKPDGSSLNPPWQDLVCMGSPADLIALGRLCPVKVYNPDAVGQARRRGEKVKPVGNPVSHWRKYASGLPTVVYAANVADSKRIMAAYLEGGIAAEHIDASTPEVEREAVFERSRRGETKVIANCGVLVEGVDLPWLVCCQILRGCNSIVLWIQACGRVMRTSPGKTHGIILDHAGACHEFGMPDGAFSWSLEDGSANVRKNKPARDRQPVTCLACGAMFAGKPSCPECGRALPRKQRKSLLEQCSQHGDGVLTEFTDRQGNAIARETLIRLAKKCFYVARAKGRTMAAANAMFSTQTKGMAMWDAGLDFNLPFGKEWKTPANEWNFFEQEATT